MIKVEQLYKSFGETKAVDNISFSIKKGEMFGLVGPDGAGKTTTIKILCGLLGADSGDAELLNLSIKENRSKVQEQIGYLSQKFSLYTDLTIDENIEFFADIHNVKNYQERRNQLLEFTRLKNFRNRPAAKLSGGMKQKLALACSLIHRPKILFLDEPTTGVDPVSRRDFWKILANLRVEGITILMTTPYLDEAERCSRVALMDKGKIISLEEPQKIKESIDKIVLEIVCEDTRRANNIFKEQNYDVQMFGDRLNIIIDNEKDKIEKIKEIIKHESIELTNFRIIKPTLENVFIYKIKESNSKNILV